MEFISHDISDLHIPAGELAALLQRTPMAVFQGEMGAGKTTFIKVLCKLLGSSDDVSSPTFSLVNEYKMADGRPIFHFDFYRINDESEVEDIGIYEYFDGGTCLIEWGEKISGILEKENFIQVKIREENNKRFITFDDSLQKT